MIPYKRQERILELLKAQDVLKIEDLHTDLSDISISTLRRDLKDLEEKGKVVMLTGGGVKSISSTSELSIKTKKALNEKEKEYIARLAQQLVKDGDVIYLDSGTTCTALLEKLTSKKITIVTTNASILTISDEIHADIILLGGKFNPTISSVNGPLTDANIAQFFFDKSFLGANGVDAKRGVSTPDLSEASKKKTIIAHSHQSYLLCDSSKFHLNSTVKAFNLDEVIVISDKSDKVIEKVTEIIYK